jgi:putative hydrolase of the HAD superfamily
MMMLYLYEMGKELIEPSRILDINETLRTPNLLNMQDRSILVFDLDDTLYLERDFVASGFREVADVLGQRIGTEAYQVFRFMWGLFENGSRGHIFNQALCEFKQEDNDELVAELVNIYRFHQPKINLCPDVRNFLYDIKNGFALGLITDGWPRTQWQKIEALDIARFFERIVVTDEWSIDYRKPHPRAFAEMEAYFNVSGASCIYFGDNPLKDFATPKERGWLTIRVRWLGGLHEDVSLNKDAEADYTVKDLKQVKKILECLSHAD